METSTVKKELQTDYQLFAELFLYPHESSYAEKSQAVFDMLNRHSPDAANELEAFLEFVNVSTLTEIQELFLRSFDVQAITTLDIGFTLFGEDYKRGQLLVHLNQEHREAENECYDELSDHLSNVLRLLPKMKNADIREEMVLKLLIPAIEKMIVEFEDTKMEKKDKAYKKHLKTLIEVSKNYRTVFQGVLKALLVSLQRDFGYIPEFEPEQEARPQNYETAYSEFVCGGCSLNTSAKDFGGMVENEMIIEK